MYKKPWPTLVTNGQPLCVVSHGNKRVTSASTSVESIMSMIAPTRMAYWLLPVEPELTHYRKVVSEFATDFNGPVFDPHATIYHGPYDKSDPLEKILDELSRYEALELVVKELRFGERFTQSCFIEFEKSETLMKMRKTILELIATDDNPNDFPHMSLFYGPLSKEQQEMIVTRLKAPSSIRFNLARIVANRARVTTREDVEYWHEAGSRNLAQN